MAGLAGCSSLMVEEAYLSSNQRVAVVTSRGDGIAPPTTMVLLEGQPGKYSTLQPVATGFGQAPITAAVAGIGAATAGAVGYYHGQRAHRPDVTTTTVSVRQGGQTQNQGQDQSQRQNQDQSQGQNQDQNQETTSSPVQTSTIEVSQGQNQQLTNDTFSPPGHN